MESCGRNEQLSESIRDQDIRLSEILRTADAESAERGRSDSERSGNRDRVHPEGERVPKRRAHTGDHRNEAVDRRAGSHLFSHGELQQL